MHVLLLLLMQAASDTIATENAVVIQSVANMYSRPSLDADVASQAIYSTNVLVIERQAGWAKVRTPDDYAGWMQSSALLRAQPYARDGRMAPVGSRFAGPYRQVAI